MASLEQNQTYKINNPRYGNDVLIKAIRLNPSTFVFISSSITPLDNAIDILKNQLIIISIIVLILAFLIGYIISVKISTPILTITDTAQNLENGNYEDAVFVVDSDIEELNDLTQVLNKTAVELSQTSKLQHELMANVSHDLKTPLTMIKAYAEMIRDLKSANKRDENLNIIINETDRLNNLVNDIMALSSLKANMAPIERETFDLNNVINETIKQFSITDVKFEFNAPRETNVYANKQQITQVIYNLVNNAVNYTGDDRTVQILITNHTKNYHISIKDSGKGISPEDLKLVWKRYYKADKSYKRSKGTGIGLSIVENIYQKHDMNYGVESKIWKGTNFWFEIPKAKNIK